jgi:hypothetical protein
MKSLLFFVLILAIVSCGPDPVAVQKADKPTSTNISFTPEIINLSPFVNDYRIVFSGVDFIKFPVDSICLENTKIGIESADSASLVAKLIKKDTGDFRISIYFKSGLVILDKKIKIVPYEYQEPSADNIVFSPDTIKLNESISYLQLIFKGSDFIKYKIDSIFVNDIPVDINLRAKDSMITYITKMVIGTFDVYLYFNGKKITLPKKLVIVNPYIDFDINKLSTISWELNNFLCRKYSCSLDTHWGEGTPNISYSDQSYNNILGPTKFSAPEMLGILTYRFNFPHKGYYDFNYLIIEFSSNKYLITYLEYNYSHIYTYDDKYHYTDKSKFKFENVPYIVNTNQNGEISLLIDIKGKEIDNYHPLFNLDNQMQYGASSNYAGYSREYFITKKDSLTGKEINYYPANDDSRIKFVIY